MRSHRLIVAAIRDRLLTIKPPTYHYSVDRCEVREWPSLEVLDSSIGRTLFVIVPDREDTVEVAGRLVEKTATLDLVLARALTHGANDDFWAPSRIEDSRSVTQDKMTEDVNAAIYGWNYTAYADNIEVTEANKSAADTYVDDGWALVFVTLRLQWEEEHAA